MLEGDALSDAKFGEFAGRVVLLLHNTSDVETDKHQGMLREKGGRGFPYLVWMDAEGNVLAQQGARSVEAFEATLRGLDGMKKAKQLEAAGDPAAPAQLFLAELALEKLRFQAAKERAARLDLQPADRAEVDRQLVNLEVQELLRPPQTRGEGPDRAEIPGKLIAMWESGRVPTGDIRRQFWTSILSHAAGKRDAALYGRALEAVQKDAELVKKLGQRATKDFATTHANLQRYVDASKRVASGDEAAKADLFLAELDLGILSLADARGKVGQLKLDEAQKKTVDAHLIGLEVNEVLRDGGRTPEQQEAMGKKLADMLAAGRVPTSGTVQRRFWTSLLSHAERTKDAALARRAVAGMKEAFGDDPAAKPILEAATKRLEKMAGT